MVARVECRQPWDIPLKTRREVAVFTPSKCTLSRRCYTIAVQKRCISKRCIRNRDAQPMCGIVSKVAGLAVLVEGVYMSPEPRTPGNAVKKKTNVNEIGCQDRIVQAGRGFQDQV